MYCKKMSVELKTKITFENLDVHVADKVAVPFAIIAVWFTKPVGHFKLCQTTSKIEKCNSQKIRFILNAKSRVEAVARKQKHNKLLFHLIYCSLKKIISTFYSAGVYLPKHLGRMSGYKISKI